MAQANINVVKEAMSLEALSEEVAKLQKILRWLLNGNIDFENVRAKGIVAENIQVDELSAITANMGKLTSGEIYGAYIATAEGTYPRVEMSSTAILFGAFLSAIRGLTITPSESDTSSPTLRFTAGSDKSDVFLDSFDLTLSSSAAIRLSTDDVIYLGDLFTSFVAIYNWSKLFNVATNRTLQQDLDSKATKSVATGSAGAASLNGGIPIGTVLMVNGGGTVTWNGINLSAHTHTQN